MQSAGIFMRPQVILGDCVPLWCFTTPVFPCFIRLFSAEGRYGGKGTRHKKWGTCLFEKLFVDTQLSFLSFTCNFKYFFSAKNETHDEGLTQHNFKTSKKLRQFYEIAIHFVAE